MIYQVVGILLGVFLIGVIAGWLLRWRYFLWKVSKIDTGYHVVDNSSIK